MPGTRGGGNTALHLAVMKNHTAVVELLLEYKASATVANADGKTPIQIAIDNKNTDILDLFAKYGAIKRPAVILSPDEHVLLA
jgi:ankyrin repeat protein